MKGRATTLALALALATLAAGCSAAYEAGFACRGENDLPVFILAAQAVPSATLLPCLDTLLTGWDLQGSETEDGEFRFWLASDRAGMQAVEVELTASCDVSGGVEVIPSADEAGTRRYEEPLSLAPAFAADRLYTFPGGCVRIRYRFGSSDSTLVLEADQAIGFRPRQPIVDLLDELGLVLCGAGAPRCPGGD